MAPSTTPQQILATLADLAPRSNPSRSAPSCTTAAPDPTPTTGRPAAEAAGYPAKQFVERIPSRPDAEVRAGWELREVFDSRWGDRSAELAIELTLEAQRRSP